MMMECELYTKLGVVDCFYSSSSFEFVYVSPVSGVLTCECIGELSNLVDGCKQLDLKTIFCNYNKYLMDGGAV